MRLRHLVTTAVILMIVPVAVQAEEETFAEAMADAAGQMQEGRYEDAVGAYERAMEAARSDSERAHATWGLSRAFEARGDRRATMQALRGVLDLQPETSEGEEDPIGIRWLESCLQQLAQIADRLREEGLARQARERLVELAGPDSSQAAEALLNLARVERDAGEVDSAIECLDRILASETQTEFHREARGMLAQILADAGHHERALAVAREAPETRRPQMLMLVAGALVDAGESETAAEIAREVLDASPDDQNAARLIYQIAVSEGELASLRDRLEAEADEEAGESAVRLLAHIARWGEDSEAAVTWYRRLVENHPEDADLRVTLGKLALDAQMHDVAEEALRQALDIAPDHQRAEVALGEVLVRRGRTDEAIEAFRSAVDYDPHELGTVQSLAQMLSRYSLHHAALEAFEEARAVADDTTLLSYEVAGVFKALLKYEEAAREYLQAMEADELPPRAIGHQLERLAADELAGDAVLEMIEAYVQRVDSPAEVRLALARVLLIAGRSESALELLQGIREAAGEVVQLGREAQLRGETKLAQRLYLLALDLEPHSRQSAQVAIRMARLQHEDGAWREALSTLEGAVGLREDPDALLMRARILQYNARRLEDAREVWKKLLTAAGDDAAYVAEARRGLADWLFSMGKLDEAEEAYSELLPDEPADDDEEGRYLDLPPPPPGFEMPPIASPERIEAMPDDDGSDPGWAMLRIAEIALRRGELQEARERFRAVVREYPESERANDALDWLSLIKENFSGEGRAEEDYLRALQLRDRGEIGPAEELALEIAGMQGAKLADNALLLVGELQAFRGDAEKAVQTWLSIPDRLPDSLLAPEALLGAARLAQRELEDVEKTASILRRILDEYPDSAVAHQARSELDLLPSPPS